MKELRFYVYVYFDQRKPGKWIYKDLKFEYQPFYVGRGTDRRDIQHLCKYMLNKKTYKSSTIKSIIKEMGELPLHKRIYENLSCEGATNIETDFIKTFGRKDINNGILCNHTDGGDGSHNLSLESRQRISASHKKKIYQYSLDGSFVKKWKSIMDVEEMMQVNTSNISKAIKRNGTFSGYIWSYKYLGEKIEGRKRYQMPMKYTNIKQVSLNSGKIISIYPSIASILEKFNAPYQSRNYILGCLQGKLKSALGFYWTIKDKFDIPRKNNAKPIYQYSINGGLIAEYKSMMDADKNTGISFRKIWLCCSGKQSSTGGFIWKYKV